MGKPNVYEVASDINRQAIITSVSRDAIRAGRRALTILSGEEGVEEALRILAEADAKIQRVTKGCPDGAHREAAR